MPELSRIEVNEKGELFIAIPMPPFKDAIYILDHFDKDGAFQYKLYEEKDEWTDYD